MLSRPTVASIGPGPATETSYATAERGSFDYEPFQDCSKGPQSEMGRRLDRFRSPPVSDIPGAREVTEVEETVFANPLRSGRLIHNQGD